MNFKEAVEKSENLQDLQKLCTLPEPYDDRGYFFIYYAEADYKNALGDIVEFIDGGMRVYYDRKLEHGEAWRNDYISKCKSLHCRCAVFYISESVFKDETFKLLCETVYRNRIPHVSINLTCSGQIMSGEQMLQFCGEGLDEEFKNIVRTMFSNEITYIPSSFSVAEKRVSLEKAYSRPPFCCSVNGDHAVIDRVRDITEEELIIPEKVRIGDGDYTVKEIAPAAFSGCKSLKKIEFPSTVETVGVGSGKLTSGRVFNGCKSLTEIVFPDSVKILAAGCFSGCLSLKRLILNDNLTFAGGAQGVEIFSFYPDDFDGEDYADVILDELKLPNCVKRFGEGRFLATVDGFITEINVPEAKKVRGYSGYNLDKHFFVEPNVDISFLGGCAELESVEFSPEWRGTIYNDFAACVNLKSAVLPENCYSLNGTFENCLSLEKVVLPKSLVEIGDATFAGCESLEELTVPENVTKISPDAFSGCGNLKTLTVENPDCKKLFKGGLQPNKQKSNVFALIKTAFFILFHLKTFIFLCRRPPFYEGTGITEIFVKRKVKIKGFKLSPSTRENYFKYVKN